MKRALPEYIIEGTTFVVDVQKLELIEKGQPENRIPIVDMEYRDDKYHFEYDLKKRNLPCGPHTVPCDIAQIELPPFKSLDSEGMSAKYNMPVSDVQAKTDFEIIVDQKLLNKRQLGMLPIVEIAGADYIFDYRLDELRMKDDPSKSIDIGKLEWFAGEELYRGFYNIKERCLYDYSNPAEVTEIPRDTVMIEIPCGAILDPYAHAKAEGLDLKDCAIKSPPVEKRIINTVPIEKTNIPKLVASNLRQERWLQKSQNKKRGKRL